VIDQYDIYIVALDPTLGSEIKKTRPCVVISPNEMNQHLRTVQIAPMTSNTTRYPWRVAVAFQRKAGMIALDQLRTVDRRRLVKRAGRCPVQTIPAIKAALQEMLIA
jgi:mRNA interferase MazF